MKATAFIATSVDGYVARPNHQLDWLEEADSDATEDFGYNAFIKGITTIIMGRNTFEKVLSFPQWPYPDHRMIVLSNTITSVPAELADQIQLFSGAIEDLVNSLQAQGEQSLYIDGTYAIIDFIAAGLLTDLIITTIPILIGDGIPLFHKFTHGDKKLRHVTTKAFNNGFVQTHYQFLAQE